MQIIQIEENIRYLLFNEKEKQKKYAEKHGEKNKRVVLLQIYIAPNDKSINLNKEITNFHDKEDKLLEEAMKTIKKYPLFNWFLNQVTPDLIFKDYI